MCVFIQDDLCFLQHAIVGKLLCCRYRKDKHFYWKQLPLAVCEMNRNFISGGWLLPDSRSTKPRSRGHSPVASIEPGHPFSPPISIFSRKVSRSCQYESFYLSLWVFIDDGVGQVVPIPRTGIYPLWWQNRILSVLTIRIFSNFSGPIGEHELTMVWSISQPSRLGSSKVNVWTVIIIVFYRDFWVCEGMGQMNKGMIRRRKDTFAFFG